MKKNIPAFVVMCFFITAAQADKTATCTPWQPGMVILNDQSILKGNISYDYRHDLVMHRAHGKTKTFTTRQVHSFCYFDQDTRIMHQYLALSNAYGHHAYGRYDQKKAFFEIVLEGDISYLRKHNPYRSIDSNRPQRLAVTAHASMSSHVVGYNYFVYYNKHLFKATAFNKKVLPLLRAKNEHVTAYIKKEKLRTYDVGDQIVLIEHLNKQARSTPATAYQSE